MSTYYNDNDRFACALTRELIGAGLVSEGHVDERDIRDVRGADLAGYRRCHFFSGIAGWDYALRLTGWPDDRPVWTGSCPCQPYSTAGKRLGDDDSRNLWPEFRSLIAECRPDVVFGEQVSSRLGREWIAGVQLDLEALGFAFGAADLPACGVGAPHIRQRLWWVAVSQEPRPRETRQEQAESGWGQFEPRRTGMGMAGGLAKPSVNGCRQQRGDAGSTDGPRGPGWPQSPVGGAAGPGRMGSPIRPGREGLGASLRGESGDRPGRESSTPASSPGYWDRYDLIPCRYGKSRRVEPGTFPLAHGIPGRVGRLRGYGNAICPEVAAVFIRAFLEAEAEARP